MRTSCCAVATFALLVVLVVLGVACIVISTCACHPALASEEDSCTEGQRETSREPMLGASAEEDISSW